MLRLFFRLLSFFKFTEWVDTQVNVENDIHLDEIENNLGRLSDIFTNLYEALYCLLCTFDISGSMQGQKIEQTRQAMFTILSQLRSDDSFNIVLFNSDTLKWRPSTSLATGDNIQAGKMFCESWCESRRQHQHQ